MTISFLLPILIIMIILGFFLLSMGFFEKQYKSLIMYGLLIIVISLLIFLLIVVFEAQSIRSGEGYEKEVIYVWSDNRIDI